MSTSAEPDTTVPITDTGSAVGTRVACVDTGSNAIRFLIAELEGPDSFSVVKYERHPIRLGHQVFLDGRLAQETIDSAVRAFVSFREHIDSLGVSEVRAIATSAVREAHNKDILVDRIQRESGIELEVITGGEEARLVHLAVSSKIDLSGGKWILVDLGGGSVEVSLVDDSGMLWTESHTMGSVRLLEELSEVANSPGRLRALFSEYISLLRIPAAAQYWEPSGFIATGGNIESLALVGSAIEDATGVSHLAQSSLSSSIDLLSRLSYRERIETLRLREDRADVILPAAMVYHKLAELCRVNEILVPHVGVKDGLILDMAAHLFSGDSQKSRREGQILQAAISMGRRYMFDEAHGSHVAELAGSIFDQLHDLHARSQADRLLLMVAAILHDIGIFIAMKGHHKHSYYIISQSDIPGLTSSDVTIVAHIARYHRGIPSRHHSDYMALSATDRIRVAQLASIMRLANGLDKQHRQAVKEVVVTPSNGELLVAPTGEGDLLLERWAAGRKARLMKETFGLDVVVVNT